MDDINDYQPVPEAENNYDMYVEVRPWARFGARLLDNSAFMVILFILAGKLLHMEGTLYHLLVYFSGIFIWCIIESALLSTLGTTPGKWLFNISIRDCKGIKLIFPKALKRSFLVWLCGLWMGLPVISICGFVISYNRLTKYKTTIWDKKTGCTVTHGYGQVLKYTAVFMLYAIFAYLLILKPSVDSMVRDAGLRYDRYSAYLGEDAYGLNQQGLDLVNDGRYEEGKEILLKALEKNSDSGIRDSILNNLSLACYSLGDYPSSLSYIEESLSIPENSCEEYSNYGNVLLALGRTKEAEAAYKKSMELDGTNNSYALYGLGTIRYDNGEYAEAIKLFSSYAKLKKSDPDGWCYLGLSYMYGEKDMSKARENLEKALKIDPTDSTAIDGMGEYYTYINDSGKTEALYIKALDKKPDDYKLLCSTAGYYSNKGDYKKAIEFSDRAINVDEYSFEAYKIKAQTYLWDDKKDKAVESANEMVRNSSETSDAYNAAGDLFFHAYDYKLAEEFYEGALSKDPMNATACLGRIGSLYYRKRYTQCLGYALESERKFEDTNILWYIADTYSALNNSPKAIEYYKKALESDNDNIDLNISLGWEYYHSENYQEAGKYADKALKLDDSYNNAKNLKESIEKRKRSLPVQVSEFIKDNYMYYNSNDKFEKLASSLNSKGSATGPELAELFETVHRKDDIFSFVLYGDDFKRYKEIEKGSTTEYKLYGENIHYISIRDFTEATSNEFLDIVDNIKDPQDQYLVIDLRGNGGGNTDSGCRILDFLLPDCVICNLIYKDGYSDSYYSDDESIRFRHIFVLADENSASCSELVTLGLKTYLDDVTIVGRKTFGKGVGQTGFIDDTSGLAVFTVSHYWNVRETNIMDKGIQPDITVKGSSTEAFMDAVLKYIDSK